MLKLIKNSMPLKISSGTKVSHSVKIKYIIAKRVSQKLIIKDLIFNKINKISSNAFQVLIKLKEHKVTTICSSKAIPLMKLKTFKKAIKTHRIISHRKTTKGIEFVSI